MIRTGVELLSLAAFILMLLVVAATLSELWLVGAVGQ